MPRLLPILALTVVAACMLATGARSCSDAHPATLSGANEAIHLALTPLQAGDTLSACLQAAPGQHVDWWLTSEADAVQWMRDVAVHYAWSSARHDRAPSTVFYSRLTTSGFHNDFAITDTHVAAAGGRFGIVIHGSAACFGRNASCAITAGAHVFERQPAVVSVAVIAALAATGVLIAAVAVAVSCVCCRRRRDAECEDGCDSPRQGRVVRVESLESSTPTPAGDSAESPALVPAANR